jgi:hypothetical protein
MNELKCSIEGRKTASPPLSLSLSILNGTIAFQKPKIGKGIKNKNSKYFSL